MTGKQIVAYLRKSFFTGVFKTLIVTSSTVVFLPLIIKQVGMETYGLISLTMIFGGMVVFADFGIAKSVTLLIGQDKTKANVIVSNALVINFILLVIIASIFMMLLYFKVPILGRALQITSSLKGYIVFIGFLSLMLMLINNLLTAILESFYLIHYVNIGFTISSVLLNAFIFFISKASSSIYFLLLSPLLSFFTVTLFFMIVIKINTNIKLTRPCIKEIKKMLSISYKFLNLGIINSLMIPANKYLLIYLTGSSALLGIFDVGLKIALISNSLLSSIAQPLFGIFSNMGPDKDKIFNIAKKITLTLMLLYLIGNFLFYFFGRYVTSFIDSEHHEDLFLVSMIFISGVSFLSVSEPFYRALIGTERLNEAFYIKLLIPLLNIALYMFFKYDSYLIVLTESFSIYTGNFLYSLVEKIALAYSASIFISSWVIIIYYILSHKNN